MIRRLAAYEPPVGITAPVIPRPRWVPPPEPPPPPLDAHRLVRFALEVLDGRRPVGQLSGMARPPVMGRLRSRTRIRSTRLLRLRVSHPARLVAELTATVRRDDRVLAVAARAEWRGGRWWLVEFDVLE
ncbi:hypothetical protein Lesp02_20430 [Lentzea sp. NBRC 105346]|uniref:Rv3235 family protein n=1 Tax=Lentzea sp. NBRC 105346 TaxID=3032205 RepID=UPI0024A01337|nr:Rv3235 family protein [Lentzea sp. NBRC 105346]GLZ29853.1 hypothetical protein Lesp02_20430 [Lentzea sp. NBRC 105346]